MTPGSRRKARGTVMKSGEGRSDKKIPRLKGGERRESRDTEVKESERSLKSKKMVTKYSFLQLKVTCFSFNVNNTYSYSP